VRRGPGNRRYRVGAAVVLLAVLDGGGADAITGGSVDTTTGAVVTYFYGSGSRCSAVLIARDGATAWAITAGVCGDSSPGFVILGDDYLMPDNVVPVEERIVHPGFNGLVANNVALIRLGGIASPIQTIQLLRALEASVAPGAAMTIAGFGNTAPATTTTQRHSGSVTATTVSDAVIRSESDSVNACTGDAGGAAIVMVNGSPRLAGTIVTGDCDTFTEYVRLSSVYNDFIAPNTGLPPDDALHVDGFESGDTSKWSTFPGVPP
jgi:Trypsin